MFIISQIARVFIKTEYVLDEKSLIITNPDSVKSFDYDKIIKFTYDFGLARRSSQVLIKVKGIKEIIIISNPPIRMVHLLKNKCKKAKIKYENKRIPLMFFVPSIVMLPFLLLGKLFS